MATAEDRNLTLLVVAVSLAFAWILWPFYAAILWGVVMAILFAPLYRQLAALLRRRRTVAALATLVIIVVMVILALALVTALLVQKPPGCTTGSGRASWTSAGTSGRSSRPCPRGPRACWTFGLTHLGAVQERLSAGLLRGSQFLAAQALRHPAPHPGRQDTKMPDVVLVPTLGGMAVFGVNGFLIGPLIAAMFVAVWDLPPPAGSGPPTDSAGG